MQKNQLVLSMHNGNQQAYAQLYNYLFPQLHGYANRIIKNEEDATEIVQELFIKIWERRCDFPNFPMLKSFMYKSAHNTCINYIYRQQYQHKIIHKLKYEKQHTYIIEPYNDSEIERTNKLQQCKKVINTLPDKCREIMELYFDEGLPSKTIAKQLNKSVHTIRNQKLRGIDLVKRRMQFKN